MVKQEMARVTIDILGRSKLKCIGMSEFNSDNHYIDYCEQEPLRINGITITVNKRVQNEVLRCYVKNDRMISVCFQSKPFNRTIIQVYAPNSNAEKLNGFVKTYKPSRTNIQKRCPFHFRGLECKGRKSRYTCSNRQI